MLKGLLFYSALISGAGYSLLTYAESALCVARHIS